ncbi:glycosyltransferase family 9 protein [Foetidibacter luteolus]|uniref:glycosyltransferase family 9 protein n=1 Tax=Foetidibacter luteolus TaxID=2608880 RepID=UPI00129AAAC4|nr:glycosyltransferase family 9 protein [Foetidibacter luteolus]
MIFKYIIRKRQIGDVLWIEPIIREYAKKNKKIVVHTKFNELFDNYPHKNVIFKKELNLFEKIFSNAERLLGTRVVFVNLDFSYERKPKTPLLHAYQDRAGIPRVNQYPRIYLNKDEMHSDSVGKCYVILHIETFSDRNYRRVFGIDWGLIIKHMNDLGYEVIQIGKNPEYIPGAQVIKTNLRQLSALIGKSSFFIGIDSGPSHIAASFGVPSLIFFGAVNPLLRHFPELFKGFFLQQYCEFAGCYHNVVSKNGPICRLVGEAGIPKCSNHTTGYVLKYIDKLIDTYLK